mmetsp:Transcript_100027/g.229618  ORF Transcript_100027/g.229618 Transcript_100027/m.229618 type:complete len:314 (+) Transcript_100027:2770-3711(+)
MHVNRIVVRHLVDEHTIWQLYCQTVAIQRNFLHMILASYSYLLFSDQMLNNYVSHNFSVCISILIQAVDGAEYNLVHGHGTIVTATDDVVVPWTNCHRPHPVLFLTNIAEVDHVATHQLYFFVGPPENEIFTIGKETYAAWIEIQLLLLAALLTRDLVGRQSLVPATNHQNIHGICFRRHGRPLQAPDWRAAYNLRLLRAKLVSDGYVPIEQPKSQMQSICCPRHTKNLRVDPVLRNRFLFGRPQPQINSRATGKLLGDRVVVETLDGITMVVFQHALRDMGPNNHVLIRRPRRETLAVLRVRDTKNTVLVTF